MKTNLLQKAAFWGAALATLTPAWGQEGVTNTDHFQLWNDCKPIGLIVRHNQYLVSTSAIETSVRSRLRSARLYDSESPVFINVRVNIVDIKVDVLEEKGFSPFSMRIELFKPFLDPSSEDPGHASTWDTGRVGIGMSHYIMSTVSQLTDEFIDEYLRVNESACQ